MKNRVLAMPKDDYVRKQAEEELILLMGQEFAESCDGVFERGF